MDSVTTTPDSILLEAHELITGPRNSLYGPFPEDYGQVVDIFRALTGHDLTAVDGCLFMVAVKLSRFRSGCAAGLDPADLRDSLTDAGGYIAGTWECAVALHAAAQVPTHRRWLHRWRARAHRIRCAVACSPTCEHQPTP
jgi:hypothetical protein